MADFPGAGEIFSAYGNSEQLRTPPDTLILFFQAQLEGMGSAWANSPLVVQFSHPPPNSLVPYFEIPGCCVCFCLLLTLPDPSLVQAFMLPTPLHSSLLFFSHFLFAFHHPISQILHIHRNYSACCRELAT